MPAWTSSSSSELPSAAFGSRSWPNRRLSRLGLGVFVASAAPALWLAARAMGGGLGVDPLAVAIRSTGWWALALLLATLTITPLRRLSVWLSRRAAARWGRRLSDWNLLIRQRRQLGLWSFAYACLHLGLYAGLDAGSLHEVLADLVERPFIAWGMGCFLMLVPLAATSTQAAIRRLKRNWSRLHLLVYPAAVAALVHHWMQTKVGHDLPWGFVAAALLLAAARLWAWRAGDPTAAGEVAPAGRSRLLDRHVGVANDLAPLLHLGAHEAGEGRTGHAADFGSQLEPQVAKFGVFEGLEHQRVQALGRRSGRAGGHPQPVPAGDLEAGQALLDGSGHVGERR